jgi:hypothetical protein
VIYGKGPVRRVRNSNPVRRSAEARVGLDPRVPCRQGIWQGISDFPAIFGVSRRQFVLRFQCFARQFPVRQGQGIGFARAGNFLRQRRELTCRGREFAISVNSRLKVRHSTVDRPAPRRGARSRAAWRALLLVSSCAPTGAGGRSAGCMFAVPNSSRGIDRPTATRLVPARDGRGLIGRERLLRTRASGGSMRGDQELRQRRDRARHRPQLQRQPRHAFEVDELIAMSGRSAPVSGPAGQRLWLQPWASKRLPHRKTNPWEALRLSPGIDIALTLSGQARVVWPSGRAPP